MEIIRDFLNLLILKSLFKKYVPHKDKVSVKVKSFSELLKTPYYLDKKDLSNNYPFGLLQVERNKLWQYHETFGTTGKPSSNPMTKSDFKNYVKQILLSPVAFEKSDFVLIRYPYAISTPAHIFQRAAQNCKATVIPCSSRSFVTPHLRVIKLLKKLDVTVLCCLPTEAIRLGVIAKKIGYSLAQDFPYLKKICTAGEVVTPSMHKFIESLWNVKVFNFYGSTEAGNIAFSTDDYKMKIAKKYFITEVWNLKANKKCAEGEIGHLVITTKRKKAFPLLKYLTGDIVRIKNNEIEHFGRETEYLKNGDKIFLSWEWASSWWQSIGRKKARMFKGLENNKTIVYATKPKTKLQIM